MGVWDMIYSIGDGVKRVTPDLSPVKKAGWATYRYSSAAVSKIDQVVRVDGIQKLPHYFSDGETRAQIYLFSTKLAKNTANYAVHEGFNHIPGATVASKLVSQTMKEVRSESHNAGMKAVQAKVDRLEQDIKKSTTSQQAANFTENGKLGPQNGYVGRDEKVKDMINVFVMTEFVGNHMVRDLMVRKITRGGKKNE